MASKDNKKTTTKPKKSSKAAKKALADEPAISRSKIIRVSLGMVLMVVAIFMVASFTSYIRSGAEDFSFCEGHQSGEIMDGNVIVRNIGGKFGLMVSYFFINQCFGLASYIVPFFLVILSLWLIGSFRFSIFKDFVKLSLLMVWLSLVLTVVGQWIPGMDESHVSLGGSHGSFVYALLFNIVGDVGVYGIIALSVLFVLIYFSVKTVDRITEFFRFRQLKKMKEKLGEKLRKDDDEDSDDSGEAPATDEEQNESSTEYEDEGPTTVLFDENGNIITDGLNESDPTPTEVEPTDEPPVTDEPVEIPEQDPGEPHLIDMGGHGGEVKPATETEFIISAAEETEKGKGSIDRGTSSPPTTRSSNSPTISIRPSTCSTRTTMPALRSTSSSRMPTRTASSVCSRASAWKSAPSRQPSAPPSPSTKSRWLRASASIASAIWATTSP